MATPESASNAHVCVTGASGFIASELVRQLLEQGYRVKGTVRSTSDPKKVDHLRALPGAAERLKLVEADLLEEGSFDAAVAGCTYVHHTSSPFFTRVRRCTRRAAGATHSCLTHPRNAPGARLERRRHARVSPILRRSCSSPPWRAR